MERIKRIELSTTAWKAVILPLNYIRIHCYKEVIADFHGQACDTNKNPSRKNNEPYSLRGISFMKGANYVDKLAGGISETRTRDTLRAKQVLYQLSYDPMLPIFTA